MTLSKTQIDKLGERLRQSEVPTDDDLRLLTVFREERRAAMDDVGFGLTEMVGPVSARRLKTINSIVDKLRRESARLSQVQDIAGLRVVRDMNRAQQDVLVQTLVDRFPGSRVVDRRLRPSHGYRAVHVVVSANKHLVEVQVRTALQHGWAMLVEKFADAWGQQVKYGEAPDDPGAPGSAGGTRADAVRALHEVSDLILDIEELELSLVNEPDAGAVHGEVLLLRARMLRALARMRPSPL